MGGQVVTQLDAESRLRNEERAEPNMLDQPITAACAWRREDLRDEDLLLPISDAALGEMDALAHRLKGIEGPIEALQPDDFAMPATTEVMTQVRERVENGVGFAILDRLLVDRWGETASTAIAWLLTGYLGSVVEQSFDGTRLYEVKDTGKPLGHGVRRSVTNLAQEFHTDGGWLQRTPRTVNLTCLRPAQTGGSSRVVSLVHAHNVLQRNHPELLARLYRPFWWDRQAEHGPDEPTCSRHPVFASNGRGLVARYYDDYVRKGHELMDDPLDDDGGAALDAMAAVLNAPENWIEFRLERGQIEYANNQLLAHTRTAFEDNLPLGKGRHLLRLWGRTGSSIKLEDGAAAGD